jgi:uncharacterized lipoprotein YajG
MNQNGRGQLMNPSYSLKVCRAFVVLIMCATLIAGCTYTVNPDAVPPVKGFEEPSLAGITLLVVNEEKNAREYDILDNKGEKQGITANRQAWSNILVESVASELARRGAHVRAKAPLVLGISLPEITFYQHKYSYQFKVKVVASSSLGWTKTYVATAESRSGFFDTFESITDRLSGQVLAESVRVMFNDTAFIAHITGRL